jgi:hypothetical protein
MFTSLLSNLNYYTVFLLMLMESTVLPVPSELVVAPAAFNAAEGDYNLWLIILFATLGADCGASINYLAGYYLGRPIIYAFANSKWGKMCLLNQQKVEQAAEIDPVKKYLLQCMGDMREARQISAAENNKIFKAQRETLIKAKMIPDKKLEEYTMDEAQDMVDKMYKCFTPTGTELVTE